MNYKPMWYFEPLTQACRRFLYGGCGGNENRFVMEEECLLNCSTDGVTASPDVGKALPGALNDSLGMAHVHFYSQTYRCTLVLSNKS